MLQKQTTIFRKEHKTKSVARYRITPEYVYNCHYKYDFAWRWKSNLINDDFLKQDPNKLQLKQATVGMMNPPYSQGSKQNPDLYEIAFTEHLLNSLTVGGRCAVIVPQSTMTGKSKEEASVKANILKSTP